MSKTNNQALLLCKNVQHKIEGLSIEEGKSYGILQDNYGEFFEDENGVEHYLADIEWEKCFSLIDPS